MKDHIVLKIQQFFNIASALYIAVFVFPPNDTIPKSTMLLFPLPNLPQPTLPAIQLVGEGKPTALLFPWTVV